MHRVTSASILALSLLMVSPAAAQQVTLSDPQTEAAQPSVVIMMSPNPGAASPDYLQYELEEATERSRRVRVALISTSAVFGVGIILAGIGASQCQVIHGFNQDELLCNTAGDVLLPMGGAFSAAGAIGMITSGIMLGVRNKQKREIERDIRRRYYGRRLQWDIPTGRLVF